jgi:hypothetical protein
MEKNSMPDTGIKGEVIGFWSTNSGKLKALIQKNGEEKYHVVFYKDNRQIQSTEYEDRETAIKKTVSEIKNAYYIDGYIYRTREGTINLDWERKTEGKEGLF